HVVDLAKGHIKALEKILNSKGVNAYNLGTGKGYSVLDVVNNFKKATGVDIPYELRERRAGDVATCFADPKKAKEELDWSAQKSLEDMCRDSWRWQNNNP
ncbi:MAG: GDP-mannose 4,6-dehydratase, partial [Senegalia sp. (in: firmicutes)]